MSSVVTAGLVHRREPHGALRSSMCVLERSQTVK